MTDDKTGSGNTSAGEVSQSERPSLPADLKVPVHGLFILAVFYTLYLTRDIALPITLALLASLLLSPAVKALARRRVPRSVGAMLLLGTLVGGLGGIAYLVSDPLLEWMEEAPEGLTELLVSDSGLHDAYERMTRSARQVEETMEQFQEEEGAAPTTVVLESESWRGQFLVNAQRNAAVLLLALALCYFLLVAGDRMAEQFIAQLQSERSRRTATAVIEEAQREVGRYLAVITASNSMVGLITGLLAWLMGLPSPLVWGVLAALLRFIPYLGVLVTATLLLVVSAVTLDDPMLMLVVPAGYLLLNTLVGVFLEPVIHGYRLSVNPVIVFVSIFFWGWLWGAIGVLIAVPLMTVILVVLGHLPALRPVYRILAR